MRPGALLLTAWVFGYPPICILLMRMGLSVFACLVALLSTGQEMVTAVGDEVDRLEERIRKLEPSIRHVDIETN